MESVKFTVETTWGDVPLQCMVDFIVHAQKPPCPCDFDKCRQLAKEGDVRHYFQTELDLVS